MEIPANLRALYRHWGDHVSDGGDVLVSAEEIVPDVCLLEEIVHFIHERMRIWEQKVTGQTPPYTTDPWLARYRFCNVLREFDRQTIAFHTMLNPYRDDFAGWLMNMFMCRLIARPETVARVGLLSYDGRARGDWYRRLMEAPRPRYGNAYVFPVSVIQKSQFPTRERFLADALPLRIPDVAKEILTWNKISVVDALQLVLPLFGFRLSFLWAEVLIDVAYQFPERISLYKPFPVGPGSIPTLRRMNPTLNPSLLTERLALLPVDIGLTLVDRPLRLSAENWEGIGCEYRKYTNLKAGHGRKRVFTAT